MRKIAVLVMTLFVFAVANTFAQQQIEKSEGTAQVSRSRFAVKTPQERATELQKEYNLSQQQVNSLIAYYKKQDEQRAARRSAARDNRQAQREQAQSDRDMKRTEIEKARQADEQELKTILGEENYSKYVSKRDEQCAKSGKERFQKCDSAVVRRNLKNADLKTKHSCDSASSKADIRKMQKKGQIKKQQAQ
ncbi:MAG: hypothetical protein LBS01_06555 [Prevotellaceae bacterium]|jgi:hypothetical protein|nr:hypothetical protein [Prevotellaceae bacterium]